MKSVRTVGSSHAAPLAAVGLRGLMRECRWRLVPCLVMVVLATVLASVAGAQSATAGFGDVEGDDWYSNAVTALDGNKVFAGTECGDGFCGDEPIDRYTMAVWIVRVVDGADPAPVTVTRFADVDASGFYARFVERLAELGVTTGCGDGSNYCGDEQVTRAQMAVFLVRAFKLAAGSDAGFTDVKSGDWYFEAANSLAASGVTAGCGNGNGFCPDTITTRAHIAVFLARGSGVIPKPQKPTTPTTHIAYITTDEELFVAKPDGSGSIKITDNISGWEWSPDGSRISYRTNDAVLFVAKPDGSGSIKITDNISGWEWSPDGSRISYRTNDELFVAKPDGSDRTKIADNISFSDWRPDGSRIAYETYDFVTRDNKLFVAKPDGSDRTKIADNISFSDWRPDGIYVASFLWSPDGSRIAYRTDGELFVAKPDGSGSTKITDLPGFADSVDITFLWSPDGSRIAYETYDFVTRDDKLFVAKPDGTGRIKITDNISGWEWSPDGSRISYITDGELFVAKPDGTGSIKIADNTSSWLSWSPDGSRIAYRTDDGELFVVGVDGSGVTKITENTYYIPGNWEWSPDGSRISYRTDDGELFVAKPDGSDRIKIADNTSWGEGRWSPA